MIGQISFTDEIIVDNFAGGEWREPWLEFELEAQLSLF